jgi:hypothetical protein
MLKEELGDLLPHRLHLRYARRGPLQMRDDRSTYTSVYDTHTSSAKEKEIHPEQRWKMKRPRRHYAPSRVLKILLAHLPCVIEAGVPDGLDQEALTAPMRRSRKRYVSCGS